MNKRVAIVPAYNEAATVEAVLSALHPLVDLLIVVDDGSTDETRAIIERWLAGRDGVELLAHVTNRGMSAAYQTAIVALAQHLYDGDLDRSDAVFTVDADAQHDVDVLVELAEKFDRDRLDALLVRRDLSGYPAYKRLGNWVMSAWASLCAQQRLFDVESGYRVVRLGPLVDAQRYYRGYRYSETIELAVVLCRLGYRVTNDHVVAVPVYRSRTRWRDVVIDLVMGPLAASRVATRRPAADRPPLAAQQSPA